jgi:hypothetical protein
MSKPTLFFTLVKCWHVGGYAIMRVTTEKPRQLYGSDMDGMPTHCAPRNTVGRFETQETAQAKIDGVMRVRARYAGQFKYLREKERALEAEQRDAIDALLMRSEGDYANALLSV